MATTYAQKIAAVYAELLQAMPDKPEADLRYAAERMVRIACPQAAARADLLKAAQDSGRLVIIRA